MRGLSLLGAAAIAIECLLLAGVTLPSRLDRHPPSLHLNLAHLYGLNVRGLVLYVALALGLLAAYAAALYGTRAAGRRGIVAAVVGAAVFGVTLLPAHPTYSSDVFHYIATGRVNFTYGRNPHVTPPATFPEDPAMPLSGWWTLPSPYGPAWTWLSALPHTASGGANHSTRAVIAYKALAVLCLTGGTLAVGRAAERLRPGSGVLAAVAFGWNPLVLIHFGADGHNDAAMLLLLAWGVTALAYRRTAPALLLFGAAALVKAAAGLALLGLMLWLLRERAWRGLGVGLAATGLLGMLLIWPYWAGLETFRAMLEEGTYFTNTIASLVQRALAPSLGDDPSRTVVGVLARLALIGVLIWRIRGVGRAPADMIGCLALLYLLAVVPFATWYQPWYATWVLLFFAALAYKRTAIAAVLGLTAGGLLVPVSVNFLAEISGRGARDAGIDALTVTLTVVPLLAAGGIVLATRHRGPTFGAPVSSAE